jgi:MerR family transcriptional regulator, redox-sensitive transcriptional activator SoxR
VPTPSATLTIGELSRRSGLAASAIRYYEDRGLIAAERTTGNQRLFPRHTLRRLAVLSAGQRAGLTLREIRAAFDDLPADRAPTQAEWTELSSTWMAAVDVRIRELQALRQDLDGCIGCGCLSLTRCGLLNPGDEAATAGPGSRWARAARSAAESAESADDDDVDALEEPA